MGFNINLRKDYGMDPDDLFAQITAWQKAGYSDEEIQAELDNLERDPKVEENRDRAGGGGMIKIENNEFESKTDDIAKFAAEATTFAVGVWEMLQKHTQNPEKIYKDIFAFGKLGSKGIEEWAKTHKPGEVPEWAEDSN